MKKIYSQLCRYIAIICVLYLACAMIVSPTAAINAAASALKLCAETVIPALFPFIFCGNMFIALGLARDLSRYLSIIMKPLFGISGSGALALVTGLISGYPVGAACAASLYSSGECSKTEAERLIAFCNNSGPMFIIGAIGSGMLKNVHLGIILYIIHILSALLCGLLFRKYGNNTHTHQLPPAAGDADIKKAAPDMGAAVGKSVDTILTVCGFVIIFSVFASVLPNTPIGKYIHCILEITGGIRSLVSEGSSLLLPLISFFTAFSGISVLSQVAAIITPYGISVTPYIIGKLTQALIAFLLTFAAVTLVPSSVYTFAPITVLQAPDTAIVFSDSLTLLTLSLCALRFLAFTINKARTRKR